VALMVGALLAIAVGLLARVSRLDRDRAFYPTVTMVVASYYVLFAAMGASTTILVLESAVGAVFLAAAIAGFRSSLWIAVLGLAAHGIFDLARGNVIPNPGIPAWWPAFCSAYDVTAAAFLAWLLTSDRVRAHA
jgi:ABC-type antimicrobial peptide transport system permease subunit